LCGSGDVKLTVLLRVAGGLELRVRHMADHRQRALHKMKFLPDMMVSAIDCVGVDENSPAAGAKYDYLTRRLRSHAVRGFVASRIRGAASCEDPEGQQ